MFVSNIAVCLRQSSKVVLLEDLASHFGMRTKDAIARLQDLLAEGSLTGLCQARHRLRSLSQTVA